MQRHIQILKYSLIIWENKGPHFIKNLKKYITLEIGFPWKFHQHMKRKMGVGQTAGCRQRLPGHLCAKDTTVDAVFEHKDLLINFLFFYFLIFSVLTLYF